MNATELFHKEGKSAGVFYCTECKRVAKDRQLAEQCCLAYHCQSCGVECDRYHKFCRTCEQSNYYKRWLDSLEKAEEVPDYDGPVWDDDRYYHSMEDYLDHIESYDNLKPEPWLNCATFLPFKIDIIDVIDRQSEDYHCEDDYNPVDDLQGVSELLAAVKTFNELNSDVGVYEIDPKRKVRVPVEELTSAD